MSNTQKWTEKQVARALIASKGIQRRAARILGMKSSRTVRFYIERYPRLQTIIDTCAEDRVDLAEESLDWHLKRKHPLLTMFALKTLGKDRGYVERIEGDVQTQITHKIQLPDNYPQAVLPAKQARVDVDPESIPTIEVVNE